MNLGEAMKSLRAKFCAAVRAAAREVSLLIALGGGLFGLRLSKVVRDVERGHFSSNEALKSHRYNPLQRAMLWCSRHPWLSVVALVLCYTVMLYTTWLEPVGGPRQPANTPDYFRDFQAVNAAVLGAQASFVGIVFPLVIAFVGLLNQGRASFATRLTIYIEETAAKFVGISSLLLCVTVAVQLPLSAQIELRVLAAATILNLVWFGSNVAALGYFILRTIAYLHPAKRTPITQEYVANVAWRRELREMVTQNRWLGVVEYGYLPKAESASFPSPPTPTIWYSPFGDRGLPVVTRKFRSPRVVNDINFGLLAAVAEHWLRLARIGDGQTAHELSIPIVPNTQYKRELVLARSSISLGWLSRVAIFVSVGLRRDRQDPAAISDTARLLKEMIADLLALIDQRQADEFGAQLTLVHEFHAFLFAIAQSSQEDFNFAQMEIDFLGRKLGTEWASEYRDMQRRAVERLADEPEFFGRCAYSGAHVYDRCSDGVTPVALQSLLLLQNHLVHQLMMWAMNELRAEDMTTPNAGGSFSLKRRETSYAGAWRNLVAGWERMLGSIVRPLANSNPDWSGFGRTFPNIREHLRLTALMVGRAAWSGDQMALNWSTDLLLNWIKLANRGLEDDASAWWALQSDQLTSDVLELPWPQVSALPIMAIEGVPVSAPGAFAGIVQNLWRDSIVSIAAVFIRWAQQYGSAGTASAALNMLLHNQRYDRGDSDGYAEDRLTPAAVLASLLRVAGTGGRFSKANYLAFFDALAESLDEFGDQPWVSMRTYSSSGGLEFYLLNLEHALLMMAATGDANVDDSIRRLVTQDEDVALRRREECLVELQKALQHHIKREKYGELLRSVAGGDEPTFEERRSEILGLIDRTLDLLRDHRKRSLQTAKVDGERLRAVAIAASARAFLPERFPLNLFSEIAAVTSTLSLYAVRAGNQDRGAYTKPLMAQPISNETSWWGETMSRSVAGVVWRDVLQNTPFEMREATTAESFWHTVRDTSAALRGIGEEPLLVTGGAAGPQWLRDWRSHSLGADLSRPADLTINREPNQPDGYEFSMNEVPVFRAQTFYGEAYLIPKSLLKRVMYHDFGDGLSVAVRFEEDAHNESQGTLVAEFQHGVELGNVTAYRIVYATRDLPTQDD